MMSSPERLLICVPTYNESETILKLLSRLESERRVLKENLNLDVDLLVIDDNSPDDTAGLVREESLAWVNVLSRKVKGGLGPAYIAAFEYGLARSYDYLAEMDADLSHQPEELIRLIEPVQKGSCDLSIGTRWMPGGRVVNWPFSRQFISRMGTGYARMALGIDLRDITSGYRVFRRQVLESLDLKQIEAKGYGFQIEMALRTLEKSFRIEEVPITFVEREGGVSKMSKKIVLEALWKVTTWGLQRRIFRR